MKTCSMLTGYGQGICKKSITQSNYILSSSTSSISELFKALFNIFNCGVDGKVVYIRCVHVYLKEINKNQTVLPKKSV